MHHQPCVAISQAHFSPSKTVRFIDFPKPRDVQAFSSSSPPRVVSFENKTPCPSRSYPSTPPPLPHLSFPCHPLPRHTLHYIVDPYLIFPYNFSSPLHSPVTTSIILSFMNVSTALPPPVYPPLRSIYVCCSFCLFLVSRMSSVLFYLIVDLLMGFRLLL